MANSFSTYALLLALIVLIQELHLLVGVTSCVSFNKENITNDCFDITTCNRTETCTGPKDGMFLDKSPNENEDNKPSDYCYAVYSSVDGIHFVQELSGCNYRFVHCEGKIDDQCIFQQHQNFHKYFSCCCFGDLCNQNLNLTLIVSNVANKKVSNNTSDMAIINDSNAMERKRWILIIPVTVFTLIILLGILILFVKRHLRKRRRHLDALLKDNHQPQESVEMHEVIHKGQFNSVWKALYNKQLVAVKIFTDTAIWEVEKSIYSNCNLSHENILKFVNAEQRQQEGITQFWIVTEYAEYGSLTDYLSHITGLNYDTMLSMMTSVVEGLTYLHAEDFFSTNRKPVIAHRDLKSRNVLVKQDLTCCIGDFGSAVTFHDETNHGSKLRVGTKRYMAPEVLQGAVAFHVGAILCTDNYSLALVLWEILSRCNLFPVDPYHLPYETEVGKNPNIYDMRSLVAEKGVRPILKKEWREHEKLTEICNAIESCWDGDADARLSPHCLLKRFSQLAASSHQNKELNSMNSELTDQLIPLSENLN